MLVIANVFRHGRVDDDVHDLPERAERRGQEGLSLDRIGLGQRLVIHAPRVVPRPVAASGTGACLIAVLHPTHRRLVRAKKRKGPRESQTSRVPWLQRVMEVVVEAGRLGK